MSEEPTLITDKSTEHNEDGNDANKEKGGIFKEKFNRREFIKLALLTGGAALVSSGCDRFGLSPSALQAEEIDKDNLNPFHRKNIADLNDQFKEIEGQYLNEHGKFDYERFNQNPEFGRYIPDIEEHSENISKQIGVEANALRLLSSSIIAANLGNWEKIGGNPPLYRVNQRVGPMQYYPSTVLNTARRRLGDKTNYSTDEIQGVLNIELGMNHLVYGALPDILNYGDKENLLDLTLAYYYGGEKLLSYAEKSIEVPEEDFFLRKHYEMYRKTLQVMGIDHNFRPMVQTVERDASESSVDEIWQKAKEFWPNSNLELAKSYLTKQAEQYYNDPHNQNLKLTKEEYLSLFISIVMAESAGGLVLGPSSSNALGWFQVIPKYHLHQYNEQVGVFKGVRYNEDELRNDIEASIEVGAWALMRYRHSEQFLQERRRNEDFADIKTLMRFFKAGGQFDSHWESGLWWNRVRYCMTNLLGKDSFNMGYIDYQFPKGVKHSAHKFENNADHIGSGIITKPDTIAGRD